MQGWAARWWLGLLAAVVAAPLLWIGPAVFGSFRALQALATAAREVEQASEMALLLPYVVEVEEELGRLGRRLKPLRPVLQLGGWLPSVGGVLGQADQLVAAGEEAAAIAAQGLTRVAEAPIPWEQPGAWLGMGLVLAPLLGEVKALQTQVAPLAAMGPRVTQAAALLDVGTLALEAGTLWPLLLGGERPATYLVLVQNNHELRATGGFISAVAPVTLVNGEIRGVEFFDSYEIYAEEIRYPAAPPAMLHYMGIDLMTLRDANWSPHLPTAAAVMRELFEQHTGVLVDGVVTVDLQAVRLLLPAFGALRLPGASALITQENVEEALVQLWNNPLGTDAVTSATGEGEWWQQRKDFLGQLTQAAFGRLMARDFDGPKLVGGMVEALERRAIQVWLFEPQMQAALVARGWDGGLRPEPGADFLAVVDANVGYNKANAAVRQALRYTVQWPEHGGTGEATLTIEYVHGAQRQDPVCRPESYYGSRYEEMIGRCYFAYSRVYVPAGSVLVDADGWVPATVTSVAGEQNTEQFAGYFVVNPGSRHTVQLRYQLPATVMREEYALVVQRQAGTDDLPLHVEANGVVLQTTLAEGRLQWSPQAP